MFKLTTPGGVVGTTRFAEVPVYQNCCHCKQFFTEFSTADGVRRAVVHEIPGVMPFVVCRGCATRFNYIQEA